MQLTSTRALLERLERGCAHLRLQVTHQQEKFAEALFPTNYAPPSDA